MCIEVLLLSMTPYYIPWEDYYPIQLFQILSMSFADAYAFVLNGLQNAKHGSILARGAGTNVLMK